MCRIRYKTSVKIMVYHKEEYHYEEAIHDIKQREIGRYVEYLRQQERSPAQSQSTKEIWRSFDVG